LDEEATTEVNWMAGGAQGSGIDTAANIFNISFGLGGYNIYGKREFHSNIKGKHSYFQIRASSRPVFANVDDVDVLVAFDAETLVRHFHEVKKNGLIIVDTIASGKEIDEIRPLSEEFKDELYERLEHLSYDKTIQGILSGCIAKGIDVFKVNYNDLLDDAAKNLGAEKEKMRKMVNTAAIGLSFAILRYDPDLVEKGIRRIFHGNIADMNVAVLKTAYKYVDSRFEGKFHRNVMKIENTGERVLMQGHTAIALGKLLGGCRVQSYYPITPASDESVYLESNEVFELRDGGKGSILVMQMEDEISAINLVNGATIAGARAATSTSGPGFSLMVEGLGWAGANESPIVITYYQRGSPSTGLPTRHEQGDLRFAVHAGHGEFAKIVLASGDIEECFHDAAQAFNFAEKYQCPVIHLADKALSNSYQSIPRFNFKSYHIDRGDIVAKGESVPYKRFKFTESGISPRAFLGTPGVVSWHSGNEHNEWGHVSEHESTRTRMEEKRMNKLNLIDSEVPMNERVNQFGDIEGENLVVSWGSTKGAIREALELLKNEGEELGFVQVRMIHPLPVDFLKKVMENKVRIIDIECNYSGQLSGMITEKTGRFMTHQVLKYNGRPMTATEMYKALKSILIGNSLKKQVVE
jgi:2-oxoglutarate ferredoxin oxidoreductase subunit alpha